MPLRVTTHSRTRAHQTPPPALVNESAKGWGGTSTHACAHISHTHKLHKRTRVHNIMYIYVYTPYVRPCVFVHHRCGHHRRQPAVVIVCKYFLRLLLLFQGFVRWELESLAVVFFFCRFSVPRATCECIIIYKNVYMRKKEPSEKNARAVKSFSSHSTGLKW